MLRLRTPGKTLLLLGSMLALGACAVPVAETADSETAISAEVMTQLSAMAAPYQDLQSVRLRPEDGCYWSEGANLAPNSLSCQRQPLRAGANSCAMLFG